MFRFRKVVINSTDDGPPYLVRWSLSCPLGSVKLHHILRSDEDRDCHDHPWSFLSVILWGGYWEHRPAPLRDGYPSDHPEEPLDVGCQWCQQDWPRQGMATGTSYHTQLGVRMACTAVSRETQRTWYRPGRILWRPAPSIHRLELPEGRTAWSLVFTGPSRREWGFHTICGFIPWMKYNQAKAEGC